MAVIAKYTLPTITGAHSDFVAYLKYDDFISDTLSEIDDGGGNLRFFSDEAGITGLPCEIVEFDKVGLSIQVWVKIPNAATGQVFYLGAETTGTTQPAVTDPTGRNAVWSDFVFCYHFQSGSVLVDSTGNYDLTETGTVSEIVGAIGDGSDGTSGYHTVTGYKGVGGFAARTINVWAKFPNADVSLLDYGVNSSGTRYTVRNDNGRFRTEVQGTYVSTDDKFIDDKFHSCVSKIDGTTSSFPECYTAVVDGVERVLISPSSVTIDTDNTINDVQFRQFNSSITNNEEYDEYRMRAFATSTELDLTEYQNQSSTGAWGLMEVVSGGGVVEFAFSISTVSSTSFESAFVVSSDFQITTSSTVSFSAAKVQQSDFDINSQASVNFDSAKIQSSIFEIDSSSTFSVLTGDTNIVDFTFSINSQSNLSLDSAKVQSSVFDIESQSDIGIESAKVQASGFDVDSGANVDWSASSIQGRVFAIDSESVFTVIVEGGEPVFIIGLTLELSSDIITLELSSEQEIRELA